MHITCYLLPLTCSRATLVGEMTLTDLVADSEEEEYLFHSKGLLFPFDLSLRPTISAHSDPPDPLPPPRTTAPRPNPHATGTAMVDNATASTSGAVARAEQTVTTKKPRPKPRKKPPTGSIDGAPSAPPSDFAPVTVTVPRTAAATALSEPIPPPEFLHPDTPLTIADRAKSRVRNAKSKPVDQDIIEIPSDEDEQLLRLSPRRPKPKGVREAKSRPIPIPPPPSIHPSQESLVTPTSDFQPVPAVSSQLPPSDPPSSMLLLPTSTPESAKKRRQMSDVDNIGESPLNPPKRRKRQSVVVGDEADNQAHAPPPRGIEAFGPPPPSFFASSSSSLPPPPAPVVLAGKKPAKPKQVPDSDDVPPPEVVDSHLPKGKKRQPKKKSNVHPKSSEAGKSSISASTSRARLSTKDTVYKSAEIVEDSDEEGEALILPLPPRLPNSESPLSDLSEPTGSGPPTIAPLSGRKRLVPEVVITTIPKKRTSSPSVREAEGLGDIDKDGSPKGKKRQKKAVEEDYFHGLDDEVEVAPKNISKGKGKGKAPPKGKGRTKPQPEEVVGGGGFEDGHADDVTGTTGKAKTKAKAKATTKAKSTRSGKRRVVDSDDEVTVDAATKDPEVDGEQVGDSSIPRQNEEGAGTPPPQDARVSFDSCRQPSIISIRGLQEDQENTPPRPKPTKPKPNPTVTPSSTSRRAPVPTSASSFARLNYGHSIASEDKPMTMAEIIRRANSAGGTPTGIKSYSSFAKGSRSVLKKIAPLHTRRKTPPPLPPKPPPPKKTKKQLEREEKWEEELEESIEGWTALSSQEREVLRRQKRDMEMGYED